MLINGDDIQVTAPLDIALVSQATGSAQSDTVIQVTGVHLSNAQLHVHASISLYTHKHAHTHTSYPIQDEAKGVKQKR